MIVDAHSHVFPRIHGQNGAGPTRGTGYGRALIGGQEVQVTLPMGEGLAYSPEQLLANLDWGGVEKAVLLQGPMYGECNQYALDAILRYSDRLVGAAYFDPWLDDSRQTFESTLASPGFARSNWSAPSLPVCAASTRKPNWGHPSWSGCGRSLRVEALSWFSTWAGLAAGRIRRRQCVPSLSATLG